MMDLFILQLVFKHILEKNMILSSIFSIRTCEILPIVTITYVQICLVPALSKKIGPMPKLLKKYLQQQDYLEDNHHHTSPSPLISLKCMPYLFFIVL